MRQVMMIALAALLGGCCYDRSYGPFQALTVHQSAVIDAPQQPHTAPRVHVTRHYMGPRPQWYESGYYLPEPRVTRACTGTLYIEEYVWGWPPPSVAPAPTSTLAQ